MFSLGVDDTLRSKTIHKNMTNRDVAKTVLATGAGVVVVTTAAPLVVAIPLCVAIGSYIGWKFSKDDPEKRSREQDE